MTTFLNDSRWDSPVVQKKKTTIGFQETENQVYTYVPVEWKTAGLQNWKYTEISDISRGHPFWSGPIRPTMEVVDDKVYKSGVNFFGTFDSIAYYERA